MQQKIETQSKESNKIIQELKDKIAILRENKIEQMELKNSLQEFYNTVWNIYNRIHEAEKIIRELEDMSFESMQSDKNTEERILKNEQNLWEMWDYVKKPNIWLIGIPERDGERISKLENIFEDIVYEIFPSLSREVDTQIQEIRRTLMRYYTKQSSPSTMVLGFPSSTQKRKISLRQLEGEPGHLQRELQQASIGLLGRNLSSQKRLGDYF